MTRSFLANFGQVVDGQVVGVQVNDCLIVGTIDTRKTTLCYLCESWPCRSWEPPRPFFLSLLLDFWSAWEYQQNKCCHSCSEFHYELEYLRRLFSLKICNVRGSALPVALVQRQICTGAMLVCTGAFFFLSGHAACNAQYVYMLDCCMVLDSQRFSTHARHVDHDAF